ncbi:MAG TPA: zinc ribbon domain-containing protein [Gaiellaceae bacterium]|nr:zinc ribbon domain-containing protein [Gaiellaceae bacterium]
MPIYEYRCPNNHVFELFQRMSDAPPATCEVCGAAPVERVLYPVAVHFKGSGFYSTDYGRGNRKPAKDSGDSGGSSPGDAGGGADKPAEKKAAAAD